jgi:hypothetical protein
LESKRSLQKGKSLDKNYKNGEMSKEFQNHQKVRSHTGKTSGTEVEESRQGRNVEWKGGKCVAEMRFGRKVDIFLRGRQIV